MATQEFYFSDFTCVDVRGAFEVEIVRSDSYGVIVDASPSALKHVEVSKRGETLTLGQKWRIFGWRPRVIRPKARISLPLLKGLSLHGATKGTISGFSSSEHFKLNLSGASRVTGKIEGGDADFDISGASSVQLTGSAKDVVIEAAGASRVNLGEFPVQNAKLEFSGASSGTVNIDGRLDANLSGASRLSYIGEPTMGDIKTSGASTLSKK